MVFKGWPVAAIEFYEGLEADNSKVYWAENKLVYDRDVKAPMEALLAELAPEFGEGKVFRPYRDVRFSTDKSPYKTAIAATLGEGYVQISANGLFAGSGYYQMMPDQLVRFRAAVADERTGLELEDLIAGLAKAKVDVQGVDALKTAPKGYPKDHPRIERLRYKGIVASKQWEPAAWLGTTKAKTRIAEVLRAARPLNAWLDAHVGESTLAPDERGRR